jgi:hypothetical protein
MGDVRACARDRRACIGDRYSRTIRVSRKELSMSNYAGHVATPGADELPTGPALTAADRCDACGAQAYVRATVNGSELLFCAHHAKKHQEKLSSIATSWHDERAKLFEDQRA